MAKPVFDIYKDTLGKWRWSLKAPNGEIIASSNKGYETRADCLERIGALGIFLPIATTSTIATSVAEESQRREVLPPSSQVFFSHSSNDKELISLIQLAFKLSPVKPYFARSQKAARNPADKVIHEIENSKAVFAAITPNVFAKTETLFWVLFEIGVAKGKGRPVYVWIEEGCNVPQCVSYITDYEKFKADDYTDRDRVVGEMLDIAVRL